MRRPDPLPVRSPLSVQSSTTLWGYSRCGSTGRTSGRRRPAFGGPSSAPTHCYRTNGDLFTAEDVQFSFLRYKGVSAKQLHEWVKALDIIDPCRLRVVLHAPRPTFSLSTPPWSAGPPGSSPNRMLSGLATRGLNGIPSGWGPIGLSAWTPGCPSCSKPMAGIGATPLD